MFLKPNRCDIRPYSVFLSWELVASPDYILGFLTFSIFLLFSIYLRNEVESFFK